ncbi:hypothetical protein ILYODFUR_026001 [Ilyodon furcidens]|uniref:Integrin beta N-terminal domain-containing protein n=1 Tax=Ilyodon furcidens TaxID=33524 RepID=A0ABV0TMX0_9TELE
MHGGSSPDATRTQVEKRTRNNGSERSPAMGSLLHCLAFLFLFASNACGSNICTSHGVTTCQQCLVVHSSCAWCSQEVKMHILP